MRNFLLSAVALTAVTCATPTNDSAELQALAKAREKWESRESELRGYDLKLRIRCYCPHSGDFLLEVRDGTATIDLDPEMDILYPHVRERLKQFDVPGLFEIVEQSLNRECDEFTVIYDVAYGFPTALQEDCDVKMYDDELLIFAEIGTYSADGNDDDAS